MRRSSLTYPVIVLGGAVLWLVLNPPETIDPDRLWILLLTIPAIGWLIWRRRQDAKADTNRDDAPRDDAPGNDAPRNDAP